MSTFTLPDGCKSAQVALFAATVEDYERLADAPAPAFRQERTQWERDTGEPCTVATWTEQLGGGRYVMMNVHAPCGYRPRRLANL